MRPPKVVLLKGATEDQASFWRMRAVVHGFRLVATGPRDAELTCMEDGTCVVKRPRDGWQVACDTILEAVQMLRRACEGKRGPASTNLPRTALIAQQFAESERRAA